MTSNSDNFHLKIPVEEIPDKNKKISEIVCSPNLKHVAALREDNYISFWSNLNKEEPLTNVKTIRNDNIHTKEYGGKIFAISNNKCASISLNKTDPYNFKIYDFENGKEVSLTFPDCQKEIDFLSFIDNGNVVMVNAKYYRAYVFSSERKGNVTWACKSMIELKYFNKIYITVKGKLIIFNDTIYEITMWDIEELSIKTRILIDWNYTPESIEISDDEELLLVCAKNMETKETRLYTFSTKTGINLSFFTTKLVINRFHLIASQKGERLFYISGDQYNLMDPYNLTNSIDASKLFENIEVNPIQEPYIIRSDKIIYAIDEKLSIKELVPDDWIEYLRKKLNDRNSITAPSSKKTIDIISEIIQKSKFEPERKKFEGKFLKWELESDDSSVKLTVVDYNYRRRKWNDDKKKQLNILPSFYRKENLEKFIVHCEILENDDFITITRIGVFIWTYKLSDIKMHYYWNDCNDRLEDFVFEKIKLKILSENWTSGRILPASSYETILKNLDIKFGEKELFREFLKSNIDDEFYLTCYGEILMSTFIELKDDKWIRCLGQSCMERCLQNNHLISKISLLSIIFENFKELSENHPAFIASMLSLIGFVVPSPIVIPNSISSHLSSYGRYHHLSKSFLDRLISNLRVCLFSFQESFKDSFQKFQDNHPQFRNLVVKPFIDFYYVGHSHTIKLREHIMDIQKDKWAGYKKPYISKNLNEVLLLPDEEPSLEEVENDIKDLKNKLRDLEKFIKNK
ncbi:25318_t:CDS:2 [Dentiscutata erythropus]|uniref:25318_t:CDS:1 n=1 Tax=Dentiscutata erythropus TaxID=1348616 RepID=A0A9N9DGZ3_9GLOM|nr:25318_t:CDS:2 [Dentiscutata erythropus]